MNQQKVEQAFEQIFNKCGEQIVQNHPAFKSAVFDLLDGIHCADERLVLKHAMDSDSFWILLGTKQMTADSAGKAIEQIQKESHMTKEDVEFVVQCVAAARGVRLDEVYKKPKAEEKPQPEAEEKPQPEPEQRPQPIEKWDFVTECQLKVDGKKKKGKVYFCKDKLLFSTNKMQESTDTVLYYDIEKLQLFKKRINGAGIAIFFIVLICLTGVVYLDIGGAILLGILAWYCFTRRKCIKISQGDKKRFLLVLKSYDDKMQIVHFLKKQGVSVK